MYNSLLPCSVLFLAIAAQIRQIFARVIAHAIRMTIVRVLTQPGPNCDMRGSRLVPCNLTSEPRFTGRKFLL
jgi:hypothetical protein